MAGLDEVLGEVLQAIGPAGDGPVLVGVDGVDGVGKTTVADALAVALGTRGRPVVRVCLDDFLRPAAQRYERGRDSAEGYYLDSVDVPAFLAAVVRPAQLGLPVTSAVFDHLADAPVHPDPVPLEHDAVVVVDGMFLHRRELAAVWDVSVFLDAPFELTVARMAARDGTPTDPEHPANARYVGGQRLYLDECRPGHLATFVVDMTDPDRPEVVPGD